MRTLVSGGVIAAALGTAIAVTGAMSASAQVARPQSTLATDGQSGLLTLAKMERSGGGGGGGGGGSIRSGGGPSGNMPLIRNSSPGPITHSGPSTMHSNIMPQHTTKHDDHDRDRHHRRFVERDFFFFNSFAFAPDYGYPAYYYDDYGYDDGVAYCLSRFRTYDLVTHTYIGLDGLRHPCP